MKSSSRDTQGSNSMMSNSTSSALPMILVPKQRRQVSNDKLKDRLIHLKKELNKTQSEYKELKISMIKLEAQRRHNRKVLDSAMNESKIAEKPTLELIRSNSARELSISIDSYSNIKETNMIFKTKHDISLCLQRINEKNKQIRELNCDSKYVCLIEKNKELMETINRITALNASLNDLKIVLTEKERKREEDVLSRDYQKVLNATARNENDILKEKLKGLQSVKDASKKRLISYEDKFNNLKLNYNLLKKCERDVDNRIKYNITHTGNSIQTVKDTEDINEEFNRNLSAVQSLEEEVKAKVKRWEEMTSANEESKAQVENEKNNIKRFRLDEYLVIDGLKKDIARRDKDIHYGRLNYNDSVKDKSRLAGNLERKEAERIRMIERQIAAYKVCKQARVKYLKENNNEKGEDKPVSETEEKKEKEEGEKAKDNKKKKKKDKDKDKENSKDKDKDQEKEKNKEKEKEKEKDNERDKDNAKDKGKDKNKEKEKEKEKEQDKLKEIKKNDKKEQIKKTSTTNN